MRHRCVVTRRLAIGALFAASVAGCDGRGRTPLAVPHPSAEPKAVPSPLAPPPPAGSWHFYRPERGGIVVSPKLESGATLIMSGPVRVLLAPNGLDAESSPHVAPEPLEEAKRAGGRWLFVGERGLYEADEPLGPLRRLPPPPRPLRGSTVAGDVPVGLADEGHLYTLGAAGWVASPAPQRLFDFGVAASGALLALALPEELLVSRDGGVTLSRLDAEPSGVRALETTAGGVVVRSFAGDRFWDGATLSSAMPEVAKAPSFGRQTYMNLSYGGRPDARALDAGHALLDGASYAEMREITDMDGSPTWRLMSAPLGERLTIAPTDLRASCPIFAYAGRGREHALLCVAEDGSAQLYRSSDGAARFRAAGALTTCVRPEVAIAPSGATLVSGCCLGLTPRCGEAPDLVAVGAGPPTIVPRPAEALDCEGPAFAHDGSAAYAVCSMLGGAPALVRSAGALGFERVGPVPHALGDGVDWQTARVTLHPGADGEIGVAVRAAAGASYALVAPSGTASAHAFRAQAKLGAFGRHLVVLDPRAEGVVMRESSDGGATLHDVEPPFSLGLVTGLACGEAGCAFGDVGARAGWPSAPAPPASESIVPPPSPQAVPVQAPALTCRYTRASWHDLGADTSERVGTVDQIGFGELAWAWVRRGVDRDTGIDVTYARFEDDPERATTTRMFESVNPPSVAVTFRAVARGYVGARVWAPKTGFGEGPVSGRFELVWLDAADGKSGRASLALGGPFERGTTDSPHELAIDGLGLDDAGVLLRPRVGDAALIVHRDGSEVTVPGSAEALGGPLPWSWPHTKALLSTDGGALQLLGFLHGTAIATRPAGTFAVRQLAPSSGFRVAAGWAVRAPRPTLGVAIAAHDGGAQRAESFVFAPDGSFVSTPLATLAELAPTPRACSAEERLHAPRLELSTEGVIAAQVTLPAGDFEGPIALDTIVLAGGCATAWSGVNAYFARVVLVGDRSRGWVFRRLPSGHPEWRALECSPR